MSYNWMLIPQASPTQCTSGMDGTCCRLILLHRSELWGLDHILWVKPAPQSISTHRKRQGSGFIQKTHGKPQLECRKERLRELHWCLTAREHCRATTLLSRKHQQDYKYTVQGSPKRDKRARGSLFNTHWKQAEQCLRTTYSSMPASLPWKKSTKGSVDFLSDTSLTLGKLPDDNRQYWIWLYFAFDAFF